jgi:hypothetical protein
MGVIDPYLLLRGSTAVIETAVLRLVMALRELRSQRDQVDVVLEIHRQALRSAGFTPEAIAELETSDEVQGAVDALNRESRSEEESPGIVREVAKLLRRSGDTSTALPIHPSGASQTGPHAASAETKTDGVGLRRTIFITHPDQDLTAPILRQLLSEAGWTTTSPSPINVVHSMLVRLQNEGLVKRVGRGRYRLRQPNNEADTDDVKIPELATGR